MRHFPYNLNWVAMDCLPCCSVYWVFVALSSGSAGFQGLCGFVHPESRQRSTGSSEVCPCKTLHDHKGVETESFDTRQHPGAAACLMNLQHCATCFNKFQQVSTSFNMFQHVSTAKVQEALLLPPLIARKDKRQSTAGVPFIMETFNSCCQSLASPPPETREYFTARGTQHNVANSEKNVLTCSLQTGLPGLQGHSVAGGLSADRWWVKESAQCDVVGATQTDGWICNLPVLQEIQGVSFEEDTIGHGIELPDKKKWAGPWCIDILWYLLSCGVHSRLSTLGLVGWIRVYIHSRWDHFWILVGYLLAFSCYWSNPMHQPRFTVSILRSSDSCVKASRGNVSATGNGCLTMVGWLHHMLEDSRRGDGDFFSSFCDGWDHFRFLSYEVFNYMSHERYSFFF